MMELSEEESVMLDVSRKIAKENLDLNLTCIEALISNSRKIAGLKKMNRAVLAQEANLDYVEYMCEKDAYDTASQEYDGFKYTRFEQTNDRTDRYDDYTQNDQPYHYQFDKTKRPRIFSG